jgi:diaminopimelate epimerase
MHGAGNDFVLIHDEVFSFPARNEPFIRNLCARRTGIGGEGLILIQPAETADFRMRFFNPDGREADLCGNGIRCAARLAFDLGVAPADASIETPAGILKTQVDGDRVQVAMPVFFHFLLFFIW